MSKFIQIDLPFFIPAEESMISNPDPIKPELSEKDGHFCKRCKDFFNFAAPNQKDETFICYGCTY